MFGRATPASAAPARTSVITVGLLEMRARVSQALRVTRSGRPGLRACSGEDMQHPVVLAGNRVKQVALEIRRQHVPGVGLDLQVLGGAALRDLRERLTDLLLG